MDGYTYVRTDIRTDIWTDGQTERRRSTDGYTDVRTDIRTDIRTDGRTDKLKDGDLRTDIRTSIRPSAVCPYVRRPSICRPSSSVVVKHIFSFVLSYQTVIHTSDEVPETPLETFFDQTFARPSTLQSQPAQRSNFGRRISDEFRHLIC